MAKNVKKGPAQLRPGKAGVSGLVKKGGGRVLTNQAGAEDVKGAGVASSHLPHQDNAARKAIKAIAAALKGLQSLDSNEQQLVAAAVRDAEGL